MRDDYLYETTIQNSVQFEGHGLYSNILTKVCVEPASPYDGIHINNYKVTPENTNGISGCTVLGNKIYVIEHFLSCLYACGINNVNVFITNSDDTNTDIIEFPIMDGCCKYFISMFELNIKVYENCKREIYEIDEEIEYEIADRFIKIVPNSDNEIKLKINCMVDYPSYLNTQIYSFNFNKENYINELCSYRTHMSIERFNEAKISGHLKGASMDNMFVYDKDTEYEGTELVRHKILDIIGDLAVLGFVIHGEIYAEKSGHTLHINLVKKIYDKYMIDNNRIKN